MLNGSKGDTVAIQNVDIDHPQVVEHMRRVKLDCENALAVLEQRKPALEVSSLGRDFDARGKSIAAKLRHIHQLSQWRLQNMRATAVSAELEFNKVANADAASSDILKGIIK